MTRYYPPEQDPAPILQPEHLVTERTLKGKTKEQLVDYALMLMEDIRGEAENSYHWQKRSRDTAQAHAATARGAQKAIDHLEQTVREQQAQIKALSEYVVNLTGNKRGSRDNVSPGANVFVDTRLQP